MMRQEKRVGYQGRRDDSNTLVTGIAAPALAIEYNLAMWLQRPHHVRLAMPGAFAGHERVSIDDPFGNRLELLQATGRGA
jgi:hypothetical protein